jgi:hypothetical protein
VLALEVSFLLLIQSKSILYLQFISLINFVGTLCGNFVSMKFYGNCDYVISAHFGLILLILIRKSGTLT